MCHHLQHLTPRLITDNRVCLPVFSLKSCIGQFSVFIVLFLKSAPAGKLINLVFSCFSLFRFLQLSVAMLEPPQPHVNTYFNRIDVYFSGQTPKAPSERSSCPRASTWTGPNARGPPSRPNSCTGSSSSSSGAST